MKIIYLLIFTLCLYSAPLKPPPNKAVIDHKLELLNDGHKQVSSIDSMSLKDFVHYASQSLVKNILVSGDLTGSIDFVSNKDIKKNDVLNLLRSALELNRYALVDHGSYFAVVSASDLSKYPSSMLGSRSASGFSSKVIKIDYGNVLSIVEAVKVHLSPAGSVYGVPDSKALIVSDLPENLKVISSLVRGVDLKPSPTNTAFKSFHLVNATALTVLETIKGIYSIDGNKTSLTFSVNEASNTLLAMGDPALIDKLPSIIEDLDREQYQVYIQVRIVELNNDLSSQIGLNYGLDAGIVSAGDFFTFSANLGGSSIAPIDSSIISTLTASLGNVNQMLSIGAALDLLQSEGVSKTISDPSVLCLNNKESKVIVGKSLSFLTGSTTGSAGTSNSLNRVDIGLNLTLKPLVASKDKLTLSIDAVLENILPSVDSNGQPVTSKQQIKTDSILHHGETIVLGGFVKSYDSTVDNSVPFLSDFPVIGGIFKNRTKAMQTDNLLLIITPYIVDNSQSLSALQADLGLLGQYQKIYNADIRSKK